MFLYSLPYIGARYLDRLTGAMPMEERGVGTPLPSFAGNASAKLRRPRKNSPIPPRRLVCAAALPPSPYTKKRGALAAAARLKMSEKKPERAGKGAGLHVAREGFGEQVVS